MTGLITKGIGGFYFVETEKGTFRAKGRGLLKKNSGPIMVGDIVEAMPPLPGDDDGIISSVYERKNSFQRPPIANVDKLIVTLAMKDPAPVLDVVDRLLIMAESRGIDSIICINKCDLATEEEIHSVKSIYEKIYPTVCTCSEDKIHSSGIEELKVLIGSEKAAFAGPSGVGKSSLTNLLVPEAEMETGDISKKTYRGKHTTRHVEIFHAGEGYVFDTPGFTSFDLEGIEEEDLPGCFPEFRNLKPCKFNNCMHIHEPDCGVKDAIESGEISMSRYNTYVNALETIRKRKEF